MSADPEIWTARKNDLEIKQRTSSFIASISSISKLREKASSQNKKKALLHKAFKSLRLHSSSKLCSRRDVCLPHAEAEALLHETPRDL